ncbi:MAG TPA: AAA family ATPase [Flavobacterium sp.]|nr:AAA family ATPase [Flavobacterium sp.]
MEIASKGILSKNEVINSKYTVLLFIKNGSNAQTYRVKGLDGKLYFLKLFNYSKLHRSQFDIEGNLLEIEFLKQIDHPNIVKYRDNGEIVIENQKYAFLVLDFIAGETIADKIIREDVLDEYDVRQFSVGILNGLKYLHTQDNCIIHNEITPQNIMLDLSGDIPVVKIIDFGYARSFHSSNKSFYKEGLNPNYMASECFNNIFSPQSDLYSVGALMFQTLFGLPPWFKEVSKFKSDRIKLEELILEERQKPLSLPNITSSNLNINDYIFNIIKKALHSNTDIRFKTADDFIKALNGDIEDIDLDSSNVKSQKESISKKETKPVSARKNKGFNSIAGMQSLKDKLINDIIDLLNDKEGAERYGLTIPNGMLLYGPPGCGKTFFAERFAEEAGFNYQYIRSSDLASIYVHGSQEKIGKLFKEARDNAPTILCFDELDALVPNREKVNNVSQSGEVNEFLTQLNNCGEDGIFVIGTTNNPNSIDPAILRAGRMDIKVFIPPPDEPARSALFELYLKDKPLDFGINYNKLALLTENYVVSDIVLIVQEVSRSMRKSRGRITMEALENMIKSIKPSVAVLDIKRYEQIRNVMEKSEIDTEAENNTRRPIGFRSQK